MWTCEHRETGWTVVPASVPDQAVGCLERSVFHFAEDFPTIVSMVTVNRYIGSCLAILSVVIIFVSLVACESLFQLTSRESS